MRQNLSLGQRRLAAFTTADHRGNNPHGTYEQAEPEGRRLNASRYETIGQAEDRRAQVETAARVLATPVPGGISAGGVILGLLGLGALWALLGGGKEAQGAAEGSDEGFPLLPPSVPAAPPVAVNVSLALPPFQNPAPPAAAPVAAPLVVPIVIPPPPLPPAPSRSRRRRRRPAASAPPTTP